MKRTVRVALLGAILQGSAHAGEQSVDANPGLDKGRNKAAVGQMDAPVAKMQKAIRGKKPVAKAKPRASAKAEPQTATKQGDALETSEGQEEQSVQLKGVRG